MFDPSGFAEPNFALKAPTCVFAWMQVTSAGFRTTAPLKMGLGLRHELSGGTLAPCRQLGLGSGLPVAWKILNPLGAQRVRTTPTVAAYSGAKRGNRCSH